MKIAAFLDRWSYVVIGVSLLTGLFMHFILFTMLDGVSWYVDGFYYCSTNYCEQNKYYWMNLVEGSFFVMPFVIAAFFIFYKLIRLIDSETRRIKQSLSVTN
ncbi:MAG: hypothetical protein JWM39_468 [Parcubacteria group bacterium]|nr:hypothetical protein [Parcubacteria group bacterium]